MNKLKGNLKESGIFSKLLLLIGITIFFTSTGLLFWSFFTNGDSTDINSLKILQLIQSFGMFVMPPLVLAYFWSEKPLAYLFLDRKTNWKNVVFVVLLMIILIPFINMLGDFNQQLKLPNAFSGLELLMKEKELQAQQLSDKLLNVHNIQGLAFNILLIALIPALGEELFFRGLLQRILGENRNVVAAIWIVAFLFSAIHLQFYGFIPRLLLGAFFGYMLVWSGNLWLPIIAHFTNNFIAIIFYYLKNNGYKIPDLDTVGTGNTLWLGVFCGFFGIIGIYLVKKQFQNQEIRNSQIS
jgi:membrane protease YdiL (CAAX protease family)